MGTGFVFAALLGLVRILSFDYGWHLRAGEWIVAARAVPYVDPFTVSAAGERWVDIHWGFQVLLFGLHTLGGEVAVGSAKALAVVALALLLGRIGFRRDRPGPSVALVALALVVCAPRFMPRPELASFLLLAGVLALLDRFERRGDARIYAVVPLQILWANLHGLFALGVALCGLALAGELSRALGGRSMRMDRVRRLAAVTLLAAAACLINPNGLDGVLFPIEQLGMIDASSAAAIGPSIVELVRPFDATAPLRPLHLAAFAALALASLSAMFLGRRHTREADPLVWGAFLFLALSASRNLALFAIAATPIAVRGLHAALDAARLGIGSRAHAALGFACAALLALLCSDVALDRFYARIAYPRELGFGLATLWFPEGASAWLAREQPPGPVANRMRDGGFLLWRLPRDMRILIDGRIEIHKMDKLIQRDPATPARFLALDRQYRFGSAVVPYALEPAPAWLRWLLRNPHWSLAYVDDVSAVFVRSGQRTGLDVDAAGLFPPIAAGDPQTARRRVARARFFAAADRPGRALREYDALAAVGLQEGVPSLQYAELLLGAGRGEEATGVLEAALAREPSNAPLRVRAGDLWLGARQLERARALYASALAIDPDQRAALQRSGGLDRARGLLEAGRAERAEQVLREALGPVPVDPAAGSERATRARSEGAAAIALGVGGLLALCGWRRRRPL